MIRRLHIEGWRAFEHLTLDLADGVTFVVAENGIGKTSLIQAASWGLYGSVSGIDPGQARRFGEGRVLVEIALELPDDRVLNIERSHDGRTESTRADLDGAAVEPSNLADVIATAFGASYSFLSRTTLLPSASVADGTTGVFELHRHLCHVFGVDTVQNAATRLRQAHKAAEKEATRHRQLTRHAADDLHQLHAQLADVEAALTTAERARADSQKAVDAAHQRLEQARAAHLARAQAETNRALFEDLVAAVDRFLSPPAVALTTLRADMAAGLVTLRHQLDDAETTATGVVDEIRASAAVIEARLSVLETGVTELHAAGAECPVCRRELTVQDRATAEYKHRQDTANLIERRTDLGARLETATLRLGEIRNLAGRASRLHVMTPADVTTYGFNLDEATSQLNQDRAVDEQRLNKVAELRAQRTELQRRIENEETVAVRQRSSQLAHKREAAANLAAQIMEATANNILTERINPLATEITHRWKRVFVNRGELHLRHDGHLVLRRENHEISFDQLSSGEKVIALLATRLLVLSTSTRASFLWLDEPLEHLDPSNRRIAASLMAASGEHTRQLLVTTYEERLARQLESNGAISVRYVKASY
jgi:DNA repair exonuclease SbcCD ATPase subunit